MADTIKLVKLAPHPSIPHYALLQWSMWTEEHPEPRQITHSLTYADLRFACPCAHCIDERTGIRLLKKENVIKNIRVLGATPVGNYGLNIRFSDHHETGIYSYDSLYTLGLSS